MYQYDLEVYRAKCPLSENDFWRLLREYSGAGLSNPSEDDEILGKAHIIKIKTKNPVTLRGLQAKFPNLDITELSGAEIQLIHGKHK